MKKQRIVVVGSGFGGVETALGLVGSEDFEVTLITTQLTFEYHAALYRSATGRSPLEVVLPLSDIFTDESGINIVQDKLVSINPDEKIVKGDVTGEYKYDYLILAIGQVANYYGIEGMDSSSFSMDTVANTIKLREHLKNVVINGKTKQDFEFVVIGGGATGVELVSELEDFIASLCKSHSKSARKVDVTLVEGSPRVLPLLSPKASRYAQTRLEELGVRLLLSTRASGLKDGVLSLADGKTIKSRTVIWTAGARNNPFFANNEERFKLARNGRVEVDEYLEAAKNVCVIGDSANTQYAGMAQTALFDAKFVVNNLVRHVHGKERNMYVPHRPIYAVPVGKSWAIVQWGNTVLWGKPAWAARRLADFRLFMNFEPYKKAVKTFRAGDRRARGYEIK